MDSGSVDCIPRLHFGSVGGGPSCVDFMGSSPTMATGTCFEIRLESESELEMSDEAESVFSAQMELTASCQDTPDTSSSLSESEFSVASSISGSVSLPEISSGPEDVMDTVRPISNSQNRCVKCRMSISYPFLHCRRCYNDRKRFLPPRPNIRKRRRILKEGNGSASSKESSPSYSTSQPSQETFVNTSLCAGCMDAPVNGIFIHGELGHQVFCFRCSHRVWMERKSCPYCNRPITKVVKLFKVDMD